MKALTRQMALFKQTMLCDNRSMGFLLLRLILLGLMLFVIFIFQQNANRGSGITGRTLFMAISGINIAFAFIASFCLFLLLLHEEKEEDTLGMILMTGISPFAYIAGRCGSRMISFLLLLALQLPFTILCITFGGLTAEYLLISYAMIVSYMFCISSLCFMVSLFTTSYMIALIITVASCFGIHILMTKISDYILDIGIYSDMEISLFYPIYIVITYLEKMNPSNGRIGALTFITTCLGFAAIFYSFATLSFNCFIRTRFKELDLSSLKKKLKNSSNSKGFFSRIINVRVGKHAIADKTFLYNFKGNLVCIFQFVAFLIFIALEYYDYMSFRDMDIDRFANNASSYFPFVLVTVWIMTTYQIFGNEIKNKTIESLLTLPISTQKIFHSKLLALVILSLPTALLVFASFAYKSLFSEESLYIYLFIVGIFTLLSHLIMKHLKGKRRVFSFIGLLTFSFLILDVFSNSLFHSFKDGYIWFLLYSVEFVFLSILSSMYFKRYSFFFSIIASLGAIIFQPLYIEIMDELFGLKEDFEIGLYLMFIGLYIGISYNLILSRLKVIGATS